MSLDVHLRVKGKKTLVPAEGHIYVREGGQMREVSREEWDERFPGREPVIIHDEPPEDEVYWGNITHNLNRMADEAGIYDHLWRPDWIGVRKAGQLIVPLREGLERLRANPERFRKLNPENGWGTYEGLVVFVAEYLVACSANPDAEVFVSR